MNFTAEGTDDAGDTEWSDDSASRPRRLTIIGDMRTSWFIALLVGLGAVWFIMLRLHAGRLDHALLVDLYAGHLPWLVAIARLVTKLGVRIVMYPLAAIVVLFLVWKRQFGAAILLIFIPVVGRILVNLQKTWLAMHRPPDEFHLIAVRTLAFPSGHASGSMMVYMAAALLLAGTRAWWPLALAAGLAISFLVGTSRVLLGVHWPADVIGGWAFGGLWTLALLRAADAWGAGVRKTKHAASD